MSQIETSSLQSESLLLCDSPPFLHCNFFPDFRTREEDKERTILKTFSTLCEPAAHLTSATCTEHEI